MQVNGLTKQQDYRCILTFVKKTGMLFYLLCWYQIYSDNKCVNRLPLLYGYIKGYGMFAFYAKYWHIRRLSGSVYLTSTRRGRDICPFNVMDAN